MPEVIAEYIDRLCTVEMRFQGNLPRGVTHRLYDAARAAQRGSPLSLQAASALRAGLSPGGRVLVVTGAGGPPHVPYGETDGPLGAVALARAVAVGLAATPVFVLEERHVGPVLAAAAACGLSVGAAGEHTPQAALLELFPCGVESGRLAAEQVLAAHRPQAVIFIEKLGPNRKGIVHSVSGCGRDPNAIGAAFWLAERARAQRVLTLAVGDNGNEIGFGSIASTVREVLPYGGTCTCPCGGGIACVTEADILIVSSISNWGAYGIITCLAYLMRAPGLLQDAQTERRMLESCVQAGGVDGALGIADQSVDGASLDVDVAFLTMLHAMLANSLRVIDRPF